MAFIKQFYSYFRDFAVALAIVFLGASLARYLMHKKRYIELAFKLHGPRAYPIVGNALRFACKSDQLLERIVDVMKPYVDETPIRLWMGPSLYVVIAEPRDIEIVLNSQQAVSKGAAYKCLYPFIGNGLISGSGKPWKTHRKMITHIMNHRMLESFIKVFDRCSNNLVEKLKPIANGETFNILTPLEGCTIDIVCETVMGYDGMNALHNRNHDFIYYTAEMYKIVHGRMMKVWLHPDWIFKLSSEYPKHQHAQKIIHNFTNQCLESARRDLDRGKTGISVLHNLITTNDEMKELNNEEMRDEIYTVYIASQDTLALTSSFVILMLGIHKEVQDKTRSEIQSIFGKGEINTESLAKLKYTEMVIKETLRLFPIAPLLVRQLNGELELNYSTLPHGCQIVIAPYVTHRNPKYWTSPNKFIPERFSNIEAVNRHPYAFVPFSGGPMGCIGKKYAIMALKIILARVLESYYINSDVSLDNIRLRTDISIRSMNGYKVSLTSKDKRSI